jgi:propionate CoA-transferase
LVRCSLINKSIITKTPSFGCGLLNLQSRLQQSLVYLPLIRASGGVVIAQVNNIACANTLKSRDIHVPGSLVNYIVHVPDEPMSFFNKYDPAVAGEIRIPVRAVKDETEARDRAIIARRAALELNLNDIVNLGIGMPEGVAKVALKEDVLNSITLTTEAGVVGGQALSG